MNLSDLFNLFPLVLRRPIREGWAILAPLVFFALVLARWRKTSLTLWLLIGAVGAALRDPERHIQFTGDALAPADGRVMSIESVTDDFFGIEMVQMSVFLALWHVHIQRLPLSGRVVHCRVDQGGFAPAMFASADTNFRRSTYLETAWGPCVVSQISGLLARRIVSWVAPGDIVAVGDRLGMIKFGSRVRVRFPIGTIPLVHIGQEIRAGITPIARQALQSQ